MKKVFIISVLSFFIHACVIDRIEVCEIKNNSNTKNQIDISFNKQYLDSTYNIHDYKYILTSNGFAQDSGVYLSNFDTLNLILKFLVLPKTQFTLAGEVWEPDEYKFIKIMGDDTILLDNKEKIRDAFKRVDGQYALIIN